MIERVKASVAIVLVVVGHFAPDCWWKTRREVAGDVISEKKFWNRCRLNLLSTPTLMPPPHRFLAPRLRGYICRGCLSKSPVTRRRQPEWLSRNATNGRRPSPPKGLSPQPDVPAGVIREFEQTPDGERREIHDEDDDGFMLQLKEEVERLEKAEGKSMEEMVGPIDIESILQGEDDQVFQDPEMAMLEEESMNDLSEDKQLNDAIEEGLRSLSEDDSMSPEDIDRIREDILRSIATGIDILPVERGTAKDKYQTTNLLIPQLKSFLISIPRINSLLRTPSG